MPGPQCSEHLQVHCSSIYAALGRGISGGAATHQQYVTYMQAFTIASRLLVDRHHQSVTSFLLIKANVLIRQRSRPSTTTLAFA